MSANKQTIEKYIDGFRKGDHAQILSCLTDDVVWELPGMFHLEGKEAFDGEIENDAFTGLPELTITRVIEQNDVVVAEGKVRSKLKDGSDFNAAFCDVFTLENAKIKHLIVYINQT